MIQKIQVLQKRLITKAGEAVDKASGLAHKDRLYSELKAILARQPGPEIAEQLALYRASLREKDQQAEQMGLELAMYAETRREPARPRARALRGPCARARSPALTGDARVLRVVRAPAGTTRKSQSTAARSTGSCASCTRSR
jgi:hypothetical protein